LLSKEAHDQAEKDYERWRLVREAEKPAPADPSPVAWSPFGVGSRTSPVAPAKLNAHIDEVMRGQTSRGVQAVAQHLEWIRRNDASSVVSTLVGPADAAVAAKILDYKMIVRHRDKNKRCVELHPGVCKKADAEFLRFALVVHKQTLGPRLTLASDHHKGDGSTLLIAWATEADDPPIGLEVGCIGQPFVFMLSKMNLTRRRGVLAAMTNSITDNVIKFPFRARLSAEESETLDLETTHQFAVKLCRSWAIEASWWIRTCEYDDLSLEARHYQLIAYNLELLTKTIFNRFAQSAGPAQLDRGSD